MIALLVSLMGIVLYTYFVYPILLLLMAYGKKRPREGVRNKGPCPHVSMVVAAYNEGEGIDKKIKNFLSLNYPHEKIELLIGSDGSTDDTVVKVKPFLSERIRLFEFSERRGKGSVLNDIVKEANGNTLVFSDANTMYDKDAIGYLIRHFNKDDIGGVCGKLTLVGDIENSCSEENLYWRYENRIKELESRIKTITSINGQIFAIRRELFESVPSDSITEDQILGMKIIEKGYDILFEPKAICREKTHSLRDEFLRRVRISAGNFQSILLSRKVLNPKMGFASFSLVSHKILRWLVPFFLISIFIANMFLLDIPIFRLAFFIQTIFYSTPILYYLLTKLGLDATIFKIPSYFIIMNLAILIGFFKYITKTQKVTWQKAR